MLVAFGFIIYTFAVFRSGPCPWFPRFSYRHSWKFIDTFRFFSYYLCKGRSRANIPFEVALHTFFQSLENVSDSLDFLKSGTSNSPEICDEQFPGEILKRNDESDDFTLEEQSLFSCYAVEFNRCLTVENCDAIPFIPPELLLHQTISEIFIVCGSFPDQRNGKFPILTTSEV